MRGCKAKSALARFGALAVTGLALAACQSGDGENSMAAEQASFVGPMQCAMPLPSGPPEKPARAATFGTATALNVGRNVGRSAITGAGTFVAGPMGGAVAGNLAARALPSEFDIRGNWTVTDGAANCGCSLAFAAPGSWSGANPPRGTARTSGCNNPLLASAADWRLDETMTGLEAEMLVYAQNGNRIAVLNRDGPDYYSGQLSTGQTITVWRD
ncbi:AprI/Inh family metalloprotease inhibitor [Aliihoeflea sp. PC F10.4]